MRHRADPVQILEKVAVFEAAGWKAGGTWTPSAADAWALHKKRLGLKESNDA